MLNTAQIQTLLLGAFSTLSIIAFIKLIKWIRLNRLRKEYFTDKTVLITGASSGLGKAIAEELYPLGAQLILCARSSDLLNQVKNDLIKTGSGKVPEVLCMDVAAGLDVMKPKIESLVAKYERIDILINNAGVSFRGEVY